MTKNEKAIEANKKMSNKNKINIKHRKIVLYLSTSLEVFYEIARYLKETRLNEYILLMFLDSEVKNSLRVYTLEEFKNELDRVIEEVEKQNEII
ncbi:MAG: hypothetical protein GF317_01675 [Candidatus Lokiarchaeota archaeon]|nr:hypothetical protein [Candidatus Lokiarchaeota archaeon]